LVAGSNPARGATVNQALSAIRILQFCQAWHAIGTQARLAAAHLASAFRCHPFAKLENKTWLDDLRTGPLRPAGRSLGAHKTKGVLLLLYTCDVEALWARPQRVVRIWKRRIRGNGNTCRRQPCVNVRPQKLSIRSRQRLIGIWPGDGANSRSRPRQRSPWFRHSGSQVNSCQDLAR
jgi:hypothetical protein